MWVDAVGTVASDNAFNFVTSIVEKNKLTFSDSLKYCYLNYLNYAKAMNLTSFPKIDELQDKIVSLLSTHYEQSYIIIFKFIRRLCLQLRSTINDKVNKLINKFRKKHRLKTYITGNLLILLNSGQNVSIYINL